MATRKKAQAVEVVPLLVPLRRAFARDAAVTVFKATSLCVAGKVFVMVVKERLVLKLPAARCAELTAEGVGALHDLGNGRLMKEWLALEPGAGARAVALAKESRAFAGAEASPKARRR